ncbi:ankyrin repeat-containing domain protein, partial [Lophiotrema nucula]
MMKREHWNLDLFRILWSQSRVLRPHDQDENLSENSLLSYAISKGNLEAFQFIISQDKSLALTKDSEGVTVLHIAIENQEENGSDGENILSALLQVLSSEDLQEASGNGVTALHRAASRGLTSTVESLVGRGVEIDPLEEDGWSPLYWAAWVGRADTVAYLLANGANPNQPTNTKTTPLHAAADNTNIMTMLLSKKANIDARDDKGCTPLMWAIRWTNQSGVEILLRREASIGIVDTEGQTALHFAERFASTPIAETLLNSSADVGVANHLGQTPLHYTAIYGSEPLGVKQLLGKGAVINCKASDGKTPLHHIASQTDSWAIPVAETIIEAHADNKNSLDDKDESGQTPLHLALNDGSYTMSNLLVVSGADVRQRTADDRS